MFVSNIRSILHELEHMWIQKEHMGTEMLIHNALQGRS